MPCEYEVQSRVLGQLHPALARKSLELALHAAGQKLGINVELTPNEPYTVGYIGNNRVWLSEDGSYGIDGYSDEIEETLAPLIEQAYVALGWKAVLEAQGKKVELRAGDNGALQVEEV